MTRVDEDIAIVAPVGHYGQAEFGDAIRRVLALCPEGRARCLIMDFTNARGVETHSVVRIRETTRLLAAQAGQFSARCAVVVPSDDVKHVMDVGGVISRGQGIEYELCGDLPQALGWALGSAH